MKRLVLVLLALPVLATAPADASHCVPLHVYSEVPPAATPDRTWYMDASTVRCTQPIRQLDKTFSNVDEDRVILGRNILVVFDDPTLSHGASLNATLEGLGHLGWSTRLDAGNYTLVQNLTSRVADIPSPTGEDRRVQGYVSMPLPVNGAGTLRVTLTLPTGRTHQVTYVGAAPPT